jgi:multidrug resistance efflux pump
MPDQNLADAGLKLDPPRHGAEPHIVPVLLTCLLVAVAAMCGWAAWNAYIAPPWTRDGTVRAYVVTLAPEIAGRITQLPVADNQFVHKGDLLIEIDPTDYAIAVDNAQANLDQARANADNKQAEAKRRLQLTSLTTSEEERQTYLTGARTAELAVAQAVATLAQAKVNLQRTRIVSPVNGYVTNLQAREGDYAVTGQRNISLVDADSFWVDGYFEETALHAIHDGDTAHVHLMGWHDVIEGHVAGVARGIVVANATADASGLASVNPIFTWVRLAQRIPVHIAIDTVPAGLRLVAGQTANVEIVKHGGGTDAASPSPAGNRAPAVR